MYKAVINDNYLCHFNQNHSKKNGQFTSGDGDGDGIVNDHANQNKKKRLTKKQKVRLGVGIATSVVGTAAIIAGAAFIKDRMDGKALQESWNKRVSEAKAKQHIEMQRQRELNETLRKWDEVNKRQRDAIESRMYGNNKQSRLAYELENNKRWAIENRDKNVPLKSSPFGNSYKTVASGKHGTIYAR